MEIFRRFAKPVSCVVTAGMLVLSVYVPVANASMIGTEAVLHGGQMEQERSRIHEVLDRQEVRTQLLALGVNPSLVHERVAALTDDEARQLVEHIDNMPAGGGFLGAVVLIFLVLLVTDILGFTDVFPFTKKGSARR